MIASYLTQVMSKTFDLDLVVRADVSIDVLFIFEVRGHEHKVIIRDRHHAMVIDTLLIFLEDFCGVIAKIGKLFRHLLKSILRFDPEGLALLKAILQIRFYKFTNMYQG